MNKIITCEECGIDYYSETIVPRESFRHVFPDIVKLETELADKEKQLAEARAEIERLNQKIEARNVAVRIQVAMINDKDKLIEQMREALQWYKEQVSSCNRNGDAGELARDRLAKDVGKRAEAALSAAERGE